MTDTISDEARELVKALCLPEDAVWLAIAQSALTAARVKALEDAAKVAEEGEFDPTHSIPSEIRAMKVQQ